MQRAFRTGTDKRQGNLCLNHAGQILLSLFSSFLQSLQSHLVGLEIDVVLLLEVVSQPVNDLVIEVIASQMGITSCGKYFVCAIGNIQDGNIEGAAAKVIHKDFLFFGCIFA